MSALEVAHGEPGERPFSIASFELPAGRAATRPPEARGLARDEVRMVVARPEGLVRDRFHALADHLHPGDLIVINNSATLPAAFDGRRADGRAVVVHISGPHPELKRTWVVELRRPDGSGPSRTTSTGEVVALPGGAQLQLLGPHPKEHRADGSRLRRARLLGEASMPELMATHGRPISYDHVAGRWPLSSYQTVFAHEPGSAEMASAGRPFTPELVTALVARGVAVAPVTLHTGVSSLELGEPPQPEPYRVPPATARLVAATRDAGGRVVAVGTTVTRALETVVTDDGTIRSGAGWTELVLGPRRPARVVTGLISGWHTPGTSHLALLEAVAGRQLVERAYAAALAGDELWHEFGDSCLLLP